MLDTAKQAALTFDPFTISANSSGVALIFEAFNSSSFESTFPLTWSLDRYGAAFSLK